MIYDLRLTAN